MVTEEEYQLSWEITEAMMQFGGSFVEALGNLWRIGDLSNRRKLETTFNEYWGEYKKVVVMKRNEDSKWYDK